MMECENYKYYNSEDDVCTACECWPYMDCDDPLPCEDKKSKEN